MAVQILLARGSEAWWTSENPILGDGEIAVSRDLVPKKYKIGDGSTAWSALPYVLNGDMFKSVYDPLNNGFVDLAALATALDGGQSVDSIMVTNGIGDPSFEPISTILPNASETVKGFIEIADDAEVIAATDDTRALTPLKLKDNLNKIDFTASLGVSRVLEVSSSGNIGSAVMGSAFNLNLGTGITNVGGALTNELRVGASGGQSAIGGTAASETLTLSTTSHATKGKILFGNSAYDEANNRLGIGTDSPSAKLEVVSGALQALQLTSTLTTGTAWAFLLDANSGCQGLKVSTNGAAQYLARASSVADKELRFQQYSDGNCYFGTHCLANATATSHLIIRTGHDYYPARSNDGNISLRPNNVNTLEASKTTLTLSPAGTTILTLSATEITLANAKNFVFNTSTGTKIGTGTTQKIGFWNATPIVQPATGGAASTFAANTSGIANDTATFDSYTIGQVVKALRNAGILA